MGVSPMPFRRRNAWAGRPCYEKNVSIFEESRAAGLRDAGARAEGVRWMGWSLPADSVDRAGGVSRGDAGAGRDRDQVPSGVRRTDRHAGEPGEVTRAEIQGHL